LAVLQFGLVLHVRTTLVACAAEGARTAANADRSLADGLATTRYLITSALSERYAQDVQVSLINGPGQSQLVEVTVSAPLPLFGLLGPDRLIEVSGHAVEESP